MSWVWLFAAIALETSATMCLRASDGYRKRVWIAPMLLAYIASFTCLGFSLSAGMPVGIAYGIWTAIGVCLVALLNRVIWADPLTRRMMLGIAVIAVGVLLVEVG